MTHTPPSPQPAPGDVTLAPCPSPFNLADYVLTEGRATPDKVALAIIGPSGSERWSYARLEAAVQSMAAGLLTHVAPGARVLLRLGNSPRFPIAFLGAIAAGLVPVPSAAGLTGPEITRLAGMIKPDLILADPGLSLPAETAVPVLTDFDALLAHPPGAYTMGAPEALAYIVFTSGASGQPRAVAHAHRAIWARRMMWHGWYGLGPTDRLLHAGAFNWTFTMGTGLLDPWAIGATALIPAEDTKTEALPLLLRRHDATILAAAPGVFRRLIRAHPALDLPRLRHGLAAGETLAPALRRAWRTATGTDLHEALGMSECSTYISGSPDRPAPEGTIGYPQPGRRVAVLDEAQAPVAPGTPGILAVHASDPGLMLGYLAEDGPHLPLAGPWFLTGDIVAAAPDGAIQSHGRADDLMNTGGFRIAPQEIEAAFHGLPGLTDCAAFPAQVARDVFVVALAVEGRSDETALRAIAKDRLARHKQPRLYISVPALPRGANGKLNRRALPALVPKTRKEGPS